MEKEIRNEKNALEILLNSFLKGVLEKSGEGVNWENGSFGDACESFLGLYGFAVDRALLDSEKLSSYRESYLEANKSAQEVNAAYCKRKALRTNFGKGS